MGDLAFLAWGLGCYTAGWLLHRHHVRQEEKQLRPYTWRCPHEGCRARIGTNSIALLDRGITVHVETTGHGSTSA